MPPPTVTALPDAVTVGGRFFVRTGATVAAETAVGAQLAASATVAAEGTIGSGWAAALLASPITWIVVGTVLAIGVTVYVLADDEPEPMRLPGQDGAGAMVEPQGDPAEAPAAPDLTPFIDPRQGEPAWAPGPVDRGETMRVGPDGAAHGPRHPLLQLVRAALEDDAETNVGAFVALLLLDTDAVILMTRSEVTRRLGPDVWEDLSRMHPLGAYLPTVGKVVLAPEPADVMAEALAHEAIHWLQDASGMSADAPVFDHEFPAYLHGRALASRHGWPHRVSEEAERSAGFVMEHYRGARDQAAGIDLEAYAAQIELKYRRALQELAAGRPALAADRFDTRSRIMTVPRLSFEHDGVGYSLVVDPVDTRSAVSVGVFVRPVGADRDLGSVSVHADLDAGSLRIDVDSWDRRLAPTSLDVALDSLWRLLSWPGESLIEMARIVEITVDATTAARLAVAEATGGPLEPILVGVPLWDAAVAWAASMGLVLRPRLLSADRTGIEADVQPGP